MNCLECIPILLIKKVKLLQKMKAKLQNLSYRILLSDGKFFEFTFFKKYGTLYDLLENLVTKKRLQTVQMLIKYLL